MEIIFEIMTGVTWILLSLFILFGAFEKYPSNIQNIYNEKVFFSKKWLVLLSSLLFILGIYKLI